jgi:hypothetical protein
VGHNVCPPASRILMAHSLRFVAVWLPALLCSMLATNPVLAQNSGAPDTVSEQTVSEQAVSEQTALAKPLATVSYGRDIRPILSDRCFRCHGPDAGERAADLRLDLREFAIADRDGSAAVVPGQPERSLLIDRIKSHDPDERMPPAASNKPALQPDEIARFEQWIQEGATYEDHWAFAVPQRPDVPQVGAAHPVDSFLKYARTQRGFESSPAADRATLCRRVFLVLTGLPPTPEELDAWLLDSRADAYEQLVERLLTVEPYATRHAEHLASIWLDAGRYADTSGIHMDAGRQGWLWRDWLIEAIRSDKPFDEFVVEQLAGDLLPEATPEQIVATGFLRNHVTTDEGGAINQEYLVEYAAERTATVGSVFLGLTVGCARCHDHKYDPIRQQDYYRLFSFFNNNEEPGLYSQSKNARRALEPNVSVPSEAQLQEKEQVEAKIATATAVLDDVDPDERRNYRAFLAEAAAQLGLEWLRPRVVVATSSGGATLTVLDDGSVLGSGKSPGDDQQTFTLAMDALEQRWLCLEALPDESLPKGLLSRASHGNSVLQFVKFEIRPRQGSGDGPGEWQTLTIRYALADVEQQNGDYGIGNALLDNGIGWAVAGHNVPGPRSAWFLSEQPFGFEGGTELRVTLSYDSSFTQHVLGRVRFATSRSTDEGLATLPLATTGYHTCGPFAAKEKEAIYDTEFGPELVTAIDRTQKFGKRKWQYKDKLKRGETNLLNTGRNATFVAQRLWLPADREVELALGSDDGYQLFLDGKRIDEQRVNRGVKLDQNRTKIQLSKGEHLLVMKICNTGGAGGFAIQYLPGSNELHGDLFLAMVPGIVDDEHRGERLLHAYRSNRSPVYRERSANLKTLKGQLTAIEASVPRAMIMQERAMMRPTFVLARGEYDQPDQQRPVTRELPQMFGTLGDDLPKNRLGLARWLVSDQNPLLRRVSVNRLWEFVFGTGIVRTSEDFGLQGEWPSHPELLDWLACEFQSKNHSVREMLKLMVTSKAFRQRSRVSSAAEHDPDNRLLSWFPRRRLTAEAIRDQALYISGLLIEQTGGPSVKPYQPEGLWREVAMLQSNTRIFKRDDGDSLWRRSLYTYWKRACPPPSLLTFDAPTREFCTIRRGTTNTPLQALVLWNDEQFVEAARLLATRTVREQDNDRDRLAAMYRRTTGRELRGKQESMAMHTLRELQRRYQADPEAAKQLLGVGDKPMDGELPASLVAAFTMMASAFLDLDATVYVD